MTSVHLNGGLLESADVSADVAQLIGLLRANMNTGLHQSASTLWQRSLPASAMHLALNHIPISSSQAGMCSLLVSMQSRHHVSRSLSLHAGLGSLSRFSGNGMDGIDQQLLQQLTGAKGRPLTELTRTGHISAALQVIVLLNPPLHSASRHLSSSSM